LIAGKGPALRVTLPDGFDVLVLLTDRLAGN
jgi:hypothetical protein